MRLFKSKDTKELEKESKILSDQNRDLQQEVLRLAQERDKYSLIHDVIAVENKSLTAKNSELEKTLLDTQRELNELGNIHMSVAKENEVLQNKVNGPQNQILDYYFVSDSHFSSSILDKINEKLESGYTVHTAVVADSLMYIIYNLPPKPPKVTIT